MITGIEVGTGLSLIGTLIGILKSVRSKSQKTEKKLSKIISETTDPQLKDLLIQKKDLEDKEVEIMKCAERVLKALRKALKRLEKRKELDEEGELEVTGDSVRQLEELVGHVRELKALKKVKLNVQVQIYKKSKDFNDPGEEEVDFEKLKREMLRSELMLEEEELKEARIEQIITRIIERLNTLGTRQSKRLIALLREFTALSKLSYAERYVDEGIYRVIADMKPAQSAVEAAA